MITKLIEPSIISALISAIVSVSINICNSTNTKRYVLYNKKYEFWLEFCKKFFKIKPFLQYMIKQSNYSMGIIAFQNEEGVKNAFSTWLKEWKDFFELINENEKIYMEPEEIDALMLNCYFTSLKDNLEQLKITSSSDGKIFTISANNLNKILTEAKKYFEKSLKERSVLFLPYLKILDKYSKKGKKKYKNIKSNLTSEEQLQIINKMSNDAFLELIKINLDDITNKLEKIVGIEPINRKIFPKIKKCLIKNKPNDFKKFMDELYKR